MWKRATDANAELVYFAIMIHVVRRSAQQEASKWDTPLYTIGGPSSPTVESDAKSIASLEMHLVAINVSPAGNISEFPRYRSRSLYAKIFLDRGRPDGV